MFVNNIINKHNKIISILLVVMCIIKNSHNKILYKEQHNKALILFKLYKHITIIDFITLDLPIWRNFKFFLSLCLIELTIWIKHIFKHQP